MKLIYLSVTVFWIILVSTLLSYGQCTTSINPITGESIRYLHVQTNGPYEYISLANDGQRIIFSLVNSIIVEPTFKVPAQTDIILKTSSGSLVYKTIGDSKGSSVGYSIWTTIEKGDIKKLIELEEVEFNTSKGLYKVKLKNIETRLFNTALTCVY